MKLKFFTGIALISVLLMVLVPHRNGNNYTPLERGNYYFQRDLLDKALGQYKLAAVTYPEYPETHLKLGLCYCKMMETSTLEEDKDDYAFRAKRYLMKAMDAGIRKPALYEAMVKVYRHYKDEDRELSSIRELIETSPLKTTAYKLLSRYYLRKYYWESAIEILEKQLWALVDPGIIQAGMDITALKSRIKKARNLPLAIQNIINHKKLTHEERTRFLKDYRTRLSELPPVELMEVKLKVLKKQRVSKLKSLDSRVTGLNAEKRRQAAEIYYTISQACLKSLIDRYCSHYEFIKIYCKGWKSLQRSIHLNPNTARANTYREKYHRARFKWLSFENFRLRRALSHSRISSRRR